MPTFPSSVRLRISSNAAAITIATPIVTSSWSESVALPMCTLVP